MILHYLLQRMKFKLIKNKLCCQEVVVTPSIFAKICELEERKNLIVVHGDVTGYQRFTVSSLALLHCSDNKKYSPLTPIEFYQQQFF